MGSTSSKDSKWRGNGLAPDLFQGRSQFLVYHFMFGPECVVQRALRSRTLSHCIDMHSKNARAWGGGATPLRFPRGRNPAFSAIANGRLCPEQKPLRILAISTLPIRSMNAYGNIFRRGGRKFDHGNHRNQRLESSVHRVSFHSRREPAEVGVIDLARGIC